MRTFINSILSFIGESNLTDEEFDALPEGLTLEYNLALFNAVKTVLNGRSASVQTHQNLEQFFQIKGVNVSGAYVAGSEIWIGEDLDG
jgi:hypothetical protein